MMKYREITRLWEIDNKNGGYYLSSIFFLRKEICIGKYFFENEIRFYKKAIET